MKITFISTLIAISLLATTASATYATPFAGGKPRPHAAMAAGDKVPKLRMLASHKLADGQTHTRTITNGQGETATRTILVNKDKEAGIVTINQSGTTFSGEAFSRDTTISKTDTGYNRVSTLTAPTGETTSTTVVGTFDKTAGTVTKVITQVDKDGVSTTETKVSPLPSQHKNNTTTD